MKYEQIKVQLADGNYAVGIRVEGADNSGFVYDLDTLEKMYEINLKSDDSDTQILALEDHEKLSDAVLDLLRTFAMNVIDLEKINKDIQEYISEVNQFKLEVDSKANSDFFLMQINTLNKKAECHYENLECVSSIKDDIKELQEYFVEVINKPSLPKEISVSSELVERLGEGLTQDGVKFVIFNNKATVNIHFTGVDFYTVGDVLQIDRQGDLKREVFNSLKLKGTEDETSGNIRYFVDLSYGLTYEDAVEVNEHFKRLVTLVLKNLNM